jgi:cytochrome c peroxidase
MLTCPVPHSDLALIEDPAFAPWVKAYAEDKELFYDDFSKVFATLIELGVHRSERPYEAAPKKSDEPGAPEKGKPIGKTHL